MFSDAETHLAYAIGNAAIRPYPYPHLYIENAFPDDVYTTILQNLPAREELAPIAQKRPVTGYEERFVMCFDDDSLSEINEKRREVWLALRHAFMGGLVGTVTMAKFASYVRQRFNDPSKVDFYNELLLVQDNTNYSIGPHTDSPRKVITALFYLPSDNSQEKLGTSIYLPKQPFTCPGDRHHKFDNFTRLKTMPFKPNSAFFFFKSDTSFHGVEKIVQEKTRRWVLLYDINHHAKEK
jgi:hypothetical protein